MSKRNLVFLLFAFLFLSGQALAQTGPPIFVSTFGGNQILRVDGTTGATTVIHTGLFSFFPEDIVVGPDGNIYICDAPINIIWRLNPNTFQIETIYNLAAASPPNNPSGPEGCSFINDDLVFNTRGAPSTHTGVWKIAGVAAITFGGAIPPPVNLIDASTVPTGTGSTFGEGTAFDELGNLLIVDRSGNRILRVSAPSFGPPVTVLIENPLTPAAAVLDTPFGVAVNSNNEIFVANGGSTFRNIQRFDSNGNFLGEFVHFRDDALDNPSFMEFDASDNLFVVTNQTPQALGGKVWRVDPAGSKTLLVDLSLEFIDPGRDPMLASNRALGLAVPPTSTSRTRSFSLSNTKQNYNYGTHSFSVSFDQVFNPFDLTITAVNTRPVDVESRLAASFLGKECKRYASKGGFCVVYRVESPLPLAGVDYDDSKLEDSILIYIGYFTVGADAGISGRTRNFQEFVVVEPGFDGLDAALLHDPSTVGGDSFTENTTVAFFPSGVPIMDTFCGFLKPINSDGSSLFKSGRTIPVKFQLGSSFTFVADQPMTDCSGGFNPDAVAWISVELMSASPSGFDLQDFEASGKANTGILFRFDPEKQQYVYNLGTKGFTTGTYRLTVFSNMFAPQSVEFSIP